MQVFFPLIGCHFRLKQDTRLLVPCIETNHKFLQYLNMPYDLNKVEVLLLKDGLFTIDKISGKRLETEIHFSYYYMNKTKGKRHRFSVLLQDINHQLNIYYG